MDFITDLAKTFGRPGNQDLPLWQSGVCLWFSSWVGVWGSDPARRGQLIPAGNEDWGKTGQDLPGIFAVKVRDAPEME